MQQGDPPSSSLFSFGLHPVLVRTLDRFPGVYAVAYCDNVFLVGHLDHALACADDLVVRLKADLDLDVNLAQSWVHAPAWAHLPAAPASYAPTLASFPNLPDLPVALEGAKVLGLPVGSDHFCKEFLVSKAAKITAELEPIRHVDDGRHFAQLVRFCVKTQLGFTLRSALPSHTSPAASQLDAAATAAVGEYVTGQAGWEPASLRDDPTSHDCASLILQLSSSRGGWGLTPLEGAADPAFYAGYAEFLRWTQTSVPSLLAFHTSQVTPGADLRLSTHPPVRHLVRIHNALVADCDAVVVPPDPPAQPPAGTLVLPALGSILLDSAEPRVPRQRHVTKAHMQHWQPHIDILRRPACVDKLKDLLDAQKEQLIDVETPDLSPLIGSVVHLTKGTVSHRPTAFLGTFDSGPNRRFPKALFQVWGCHSLGLQPPPSRALAQAEVRCRCSCKALYDAAGHHAQTCVSHSRSAFHRGHEDVLAVWKELSSLAEVPATVLPAQLPRPPLTGDDRHADIKWELRTRRCVAVVGDVSIVHPFQGKGRGRETWGSYHASRLQERVNAKNKIYKKFHEDQNMMFLGLVGTTLGRLSPDAILMSFGLAHRAAEAYFVAHGLDAVSPTSGKLTPAFLLRRSNYEHRFTSRLSLALCRAAGSRGVPASAPHYRADTELAAVLAGARRRRR